MEISVVVPVYNGEKFLKETLESIQSQTFTDFEVLVVDDGSNDATASIVADFGVLDKRFKFIPLAHQGAPGHCRNEGLRRAKGKYLVYLDSDDSMYPTMLEDMHALMDEETDLVIGNAEYVDVVNKCVVDNEMGSFFSKDSFDYNDLFSINPFPCNKMYKRDFLVESGVSYLEGVFNQDLGYFLCLVMHKPRFKVLKKKIMEYHIRPNSITTSKKTIKKHMDILQVFDQVFAEYAKSDAREMEYGLYEMFIKTMMYKISFFDLRKDQKEIKEIRSYLYEHCPNWYKREEYLNYYSKKKQLYNTLVVRYQLYSVIGLYKSLKRG